MFGYSEEKDMDNIKHEVMEQCALNPFKITVSIPKVESLCCNHSISNEDALNVDEMITPIIPSTKGYKVKDPIILLERCDKIWETLKVIKDVQHTKSFGTSNVVPSNTTTQLAPYVEYQPVLNNYNDVLPNFKFSVIATKKLFNCIACGKQFNCNQTLKRHTQRVHTNCTPTKQKFALYEANISKDEQKESDVSEKDGAEYCKEAHSENCGNELRTDVSTQSAPSPASNIDDNIPLQQKKTDILMYSRDTVSSTESIPKDWQKRLLCKELEHNEESTTLQHNATSLTCTLCKQIVKNMRQHLIDYHKIKSPDFMLKNLNHVSSLPNSKELEVKVTSNRELRKNEATQKEHTLVFHVEKKRKLNKLSTGSGKEQAVSNNNELWLQESHKRDTRQCEICLGVYKLCSFYKHMRTHRKRGETKENVHLSNFKYLKSPLYLKKLNSGLCNASAGNTGDGKHIDQKNENLLSKECIEECVMSNKDEHKTIEREHNQKYNNICSCGRFFREHTLATHKKKCSISNKVIGRTIESNENRLDECAKCNSPDRDSGIGINITIKKKNNSYEIIEKDHEKEDFNCSKNAAALSDMSENLMRIKLQHQLQERSEYSESHSILKIQSADVDTDIDIEHDSQISSHNNDITDSANEAIDAFCNEKLLRELKVEQNSESYDKNANCKLVPKKLLSKTNFPIKCNICVCGRKFYTRKALQVHMSKHSNSKLICGYCNVSFSNITTWNKHQCPIHEGKKFHQIPNELYCPYCNTTVSTYGKFDDHIRKKHFDSLVPYQCYHCPKRFPTCATRRQHILEEHRKNTCCICKNKYQDHLMSRHTAYHYGLGYPCHSCKKAYSSKSNILVHNRKVHNNLHAAKHDCYKSSLAHPIEDNIYKENSISRKSLVGSKSIEPES